MKLAEALEKMEMSREEYDAAVDELRHEMSKELPAVLVPEFRIISTCLARDAALAFLADLDGTQ